MWSHQSSSNNFNHKVNYLKMIISLVVACISQELISESGDVGESQWTHCWWLVFACQAAPDIAWWIICPTGNNHSCLPRARALHTMRNISSMFIPSWYSQIVDYCAIWWRMHYINIINTVRYNLLSSNIIWSSLDLFFQNTKI